MKPGTAALRVQELRITVGRELAATAYCVVHEAWLPDGTEAVLKRGLVGDETRTEIEALRVYDGDGAVRLLAWDVREGVLVLERIRPGTPVVNRENDDATLVIADVMGRLWRPPSATFRDVSTLASGFEPVHGLPLLDEARATFLQLVATSPDPVLLHGDLHHWNVLASGDGWVAIDPKGWAGDPAYDAGAMLRNPMPLVLKAPDLRGLLSRRIEALAGRLSLDPRRVRGWGFAQAVLAAAWSIEDGEAWEDWIRIAQALV